MKLLPLTQGYFAKVDDDVFEWAKNLKWRYIKPGYAGRTEYCGTYWGKPLYKTIRLHRNIMNAKKGQVVDHKDRDGLNCQRYNLRIGTQQQNCFNRGAFQQKHLKGVQKAYKGWDAYIKINGKQSHIGNFPTEHLAGVARDLWALHLHGEYADTNFNVVAFG